MVIKYVNEKYPLFFKRAAILAGPGILLPIIMYILFGPIAAALLGLVPGFMWLVVGHIEELDLKLVEIWEDYAEWKRKS